MRRLIYPLLRGYLRVYHLVVRPITLGVRTIVISASSEVLLVKHTYTPGWHFPGGGVDRGETLLEAAMREVREETGLICVPDDAQFMGMFANFSDFRNDHIGLFLVRIDTAPAVRKAPDFEIAAAGFFPLAALPADLSRGTARRIAELVSKSRVAPDW